MARIITRRSRQVYERPNYDQSVFISIAASLPEANKSIGYRLCERT